MAMHCSFEFVWNLAEGLVLHSFLHEDFIREKDDLSRLTHCPLYFVSSPPSPPYLSHPHQATLCQLCDFAHLTLASYQFKHRCITQIFVKERSLQSITWAQSTPSMSEQADLKGFWPYWREARSQEGRP